MIVTMEELNILQEIESFTPKMTKVQKRLALRILEEPMMAAFSSIDQLSKEASVSTASVVRFANALGYEGYSELQAKLQEYCRSLLIPVRRLDSNYKNSKNGESILHSVCEQQLSNLKDIDTFEVDKKISKTVELIRNSRHIYTLGVRGSYAASYYLGHHLDRVLRNCDILESDDRLPEYLERMTSEDLLILINMPRYDRRILTAAKIVKDKGVKLVAISDTLLAPYASIADVFFSAPNQSSDFHNSLVSTFLIIETIISSVISSEYLKARENLSNMEPVLNQLNTFIDT